MSTIAEMFPLEKTYLFLYKPTILDNKLVTGMIRPFKDQNRDKITMTFLDGGKEKFQIVKAPEILAVLDNEGDVAIKGFVGKFKILSPHHFNRLILNEVIELQKAGSFEIAL